MNTVEHIEWLTRKAKSFNRSAIAANAEDNATAERSALAALAGTIHELAIYGGDEEADMLAVDLATVRRMVCAQAPALTEDDDWATAILLTAHRED